jgi:hypothetical protein
MSNGDKNVSPWIGVVLIAIGLVAIVVFAFLKIPEGSLAIGVVTAGIMIVHGRQSAQVQKDYRVLKNSMRPPPSLVDEQEKKQLFSPPPPEKNE